MAGKRSCERPPRQRLAKLRGAGRPSQSADSGFCYNLRIVAQTNFMGLGPGARDAERMPVNMQPMVPGRISVIVATLNSERTLQEAIDSVGEQTFANKELIVIDGGSTDATVSIIERNSARVSVWRSEKDGGNYEAFNKGVRCATGEWLYILGADDYLWSPRSLEEMAPELARAYPMCRVVYGSVAYVNDAGEVLQMLGRPWDEARTHFGDMMTIPHQGVFHHRSLFASYGPFDESFRMAGDYEFLLRELTHAEARFAPGTIVAGYRFGGGSSLPRNAFKVLLEYRRAQKKNGAARPSAYWILIAARTAARMLVWQVLGGARAGRVDDWLRKRRGLPEIWTRV
jgi:hypothetical protein